MRKISGFTSYNSSSQRQSETSSSQLDLESSAKCKVNSRYAGYLIDQCFSQDETLKDLHSGYQVYLLVSKIILSGCIFGSNHSIFGQLAQDGEAKKNWFCIAS